MEDFINVLVLTLKIILRIATVLFILALIYHFVFLPIRTRSFRKKAGEGSICKFYIFEEKHTGKIIQRIGDSVQIEFLDENNKVTRRISLTSNIYPSW